MSVTVALMDTKQQSKALTAACELFTVNHHLVECLEAYGKRRAKFEPDYGADPIDCEDHLGELANRAHDTGELCRTAGLTALSELAFALDRKLRAVLVKGPTAAKDALPGLVSLTKDAEKALDVAEDARTEVVL